jgi:hypothetical protein
MTKHHGLIPLDQILPRAGEHRAHAHAPARSAPASAPPPHGQDLVLARLKRLGKPLTRENYLREAAPGHDWTDPEVLAHLPAHLR